MPTDTTCTHLRKNLAGIFDEVVDQQEIVIVSAKAIVRCGLDSRE